MLQTKIIEAIIELGLSEFEGKIYSLLLETKTPTISALCVETGSYRRKVYEALEKLKEAGLIERENDFSRNIKIKSPVIIDSLLKAKKYQLNKVSLDYQDLLPSLLTNFYVEGKEPSIRIFEGVNKFKYLFNILLDETKGDSEMLSYNEGDDLYNIIDLNYFVNIWVEKRISKNIYAKVLANGENRTAPQEIKRDQKRLRKVKLLNNTKDSKGCFWILDKKLILWDTATPKAVLIENELLSNMFKEVFESIWSNTKS